MIPRRVMLLVLVSALVFASCIGVAALPQDETRAKVAEAVSLMLKDRSLAVSRLRALGEPAIPYVAEILKSENKPVASVRLTLLNFIAEAKGNESDAALIALLSDDEPYVRGFAAVALGERKLKLAMPKLIALLNDKEIYMSRAITDPYREEHTLVRDAAITALRSVTGQDLAKRKSQEEQAKAWQRWWQKQPR